jgi:SpoVK/Ycf46/Vps4 family AAA+-type ATPase
MLSRLINKVETDSQYGAWIPKRNRFLQALNGLQGMIGNERTKDDIAKQVMTLIRQKDHKDVMLNTVLCGPPGVGKTEIAKKLALIFNSLGFLEKGEPIAQEQEKTRSIKLDAANLELIVPLIFVASFMFTASKFLYRKGGYSLLLGTGLILVIISYYLYTKLYSKNKTGYTVDQAVKVDRKVKDESDDDLVTVVSREDFIGQWVGWTTEKTKTLLQKNHGKVLFIDEAYSLVKSERDQYGIEALDVINRYISEHPRNIIVILAGYREDMNNLFESQKGLFRRFMWNFDCSGYSLQELYQIFLLQLKKRDLVLRNKDVKEIRKLFKDIKQFPSFAGDTERLVNYCNVEHSGLEKDDNIIDLEDVRLGFEKLQENLDLLKYKNKKSVMEQLQDLREAVY